MDFHNAFLLLVGQEREEQGIDTDILYSNSSDKNPNSFFGGMKRLYVQGSGRNNNTARNELKTCWYNIHAIGYECA